MKSNQWFTLACAERADKVSKAWAVLVHDSMRCKDVYRQLQAKGDFPSAEYDLQLSCESTPLDKPMQRLRDTPA